MPEEDHDIVVVGGGTSGTFAAGAAADKGLDVAVLERKPEEEAGHIACGDAIHDPTNEEEFSGPFDMESVAERAQSDNNIRRGLYLDEELGVEREIDFADNPGNVVDRWAWGRALLDEAEDAGAEIHYDTVVNDVLQDGKVEGVEAVRDGEPVSYNADLVIDATGALSDVQDWINFEDLEGDTAFDTNVNYRQFGSAYREIIELQKPLSEFEGVEDYSDALVVKPTKEYGYLWYFPRSETEINVGLGFQMNQEPMKLVEVLREDIQDRPEYQGAEVKDKLGAALGLRRPLDSAVAPGFITVGDAAGMVSPTTGKGITGAAISGWSAGEVGGEAVLDGDVSEENMWDHNHYIFSKHGEGAKLAKQDVYNITGSAYEMDELRGGIATLPIDPLMDAVSGSSGDYSWRDLASVLGGLGARNFQQWRKGTFDDLDTTQRRTLEVLREVYEVTGPAEELRQHYEAYPEDREDFEAWKQRRDNIDQEIVDLTGADPKY
ncbi:MAG: geranylgeranyl reductase family protein [Candidatus Nanohalobium sp.]